MLGESIERAVGRGVCRLPSQAQNAGDTGKQDKIVEVLCGKRRKVQVPGARDFAGEDGICGLCGHCGQRLWPGGARRVENAAKALAT